MHDFSWLPWVHSLHWPRDSLVSDHDEGPNKSPCYLVASTILSQWTYISAMDVFETTADLIHKVLEMGIRKRLARANDLMKIRFHQFLYKVTNRRHTMLKVSGRPLETVKLCLHFVEVLQIDDIHIKYRSNLFPKRVEEIVSVIVMSPAQRNLRFHDH